MRARLVLVALFAAALARADQTVTIGPGLSFNPSTVTVAPGEKVIWNWAEGPHSTTSDTTVGPEVWDSGVQFAGFTFSHTFTTPGTYPYYCSVHSFPGGTAMNGTVVVAASTPTPTPTLTPTVTPTPGGAAVPDLGATGRLAFLAGIAVIALLLLRASHPR